MSVKRYKLEHCECEGYDCTNDPHAEMVPDDMGEWRRNEDYERIERERDALQEKLSAAIANAENAWNEAIANGGERDRMKRERDALLRVYRAAEWCDCSLCIAMSAYRVGFGEVDHD